MLLTFKNNRLSKLIFLSILALGLAGCVSTNAQDEQVINSTIEKYESCRADAQMMETSAQQTASTAQYLASARAMDNCVSYAREQRISHLNHQDIMQMMAISTFNYIKGGDVISAEKMIVKFKQQFPRKDLYFANHTSFLDTATALIKANELSIFELNSLNISSVVKSEIERKNYWLTH